MKRLSIWILAAAVVVSGSFAAPAMACDGEKKAEAAVAAKADEAKPVTAEGKGGCAKSAAEKAALTAEGHAGCAKSAAEKAALTAEGKGGCAKDAKAKGGCSKGTAAATVAKNDEKK
jgi:hypothetical protein